MSIYTGLNVSLFLNDVNNANESLRNLGLHREDFDHIRGLSSVLQTTNQFHMLANLDVDYKKEVYANYRSGLAITSELSNVTDFNNGLQFDVRINNQLRAGAIKYKYLDHGSGTIKSADISTSRVSSWSQIPQNTGPISYGADVNINPYDGSNASTGDANKSILKLKDIIFKGEISPKRFAAEVPTDTVTVNINGTNRLLYAMRNIPITFDGFFKNATVTTKIADPSIPATILFIDRSTEPATEVARTGVTGQATNDAQYSVTRSGDKTVDVYTKPDGLLELTISPVNLNVLPVVTLKNLEKVNLKNQNLEAMPDWFGISGGNISGHGDQLVEVRMTGNPLYKSSDTANTQLQNIPASVLTLEINANFSDSTTVDISQLKAGSGSTSLTASSLRHLYWDSYSSGKQRRMNDTGKTPKVNSATIRTYSVRSHVYTALDHSVTSSATLQYLNIYNNNISSATNAGGTSGQTVAITSTDIRTINCDHNAFPVINVAGKTLLESYSHRGNYGSGAIDITGSGGFFTGCVGLTSLNFEGTYITGDIQNPFRQLPALTSLNLMNTRLTGRMLLATFSGTTNLATFRCSGANFDSAIGSNNFFGNDHIPIPNEEPGAVGSQYGGGFFAGTMKDNANEEYWLVVADKSHEQIHSRYNQMGNNGPQGSTDVRTGLDNTEDELGNPVDTNYAAANYALGLNVTVGDVTYDDWYIPAQNELELLYRNFKPTSQANNTSGGNNPHSVPPYNSSYTATNPGQTGLGGYATGGPQSFSTPATQQMITNSSFTSGLTGWTAFNGSTASVPSGSNSVRISQDIAGTVAGGVESDTDAVAGGGGIFQTFTLTPGTYEIDTGVTNIQQASISSGSFVVGELYEIENLGTAPTYNSITYSNINQSNNRITLGSGHGLTNGTIVTFSHVSGVTESFTNLVDATNYKVVDTAAASIKLEPIGGGGAINIAQSADVTHAYTITGGDGSNYAFNAGTDRNGATGTSDPDITIYLGDTATFDLTALGGGHPLYIKTALGSGTTNQITNSTVTGQGTGNVSFTPTSAGTYYYQCSAHAAMEGTITVVQRTGTFGIAVDRNANWNVVTGLTGTRTVGDSFTAATTGTTLYGGSVFLNISNLFKDDDVWVYVSQTTDPDGQSTGNSVAHVNFNTSGGATTTPTDGTFTVDTSGTYLMSFRSFSCNFDVTKASIRSRQGYYWSSTESGSNSTNGIGINFNDGEQVDVNKNHRYYVRPVRRVNKNSASSAEQQGTSTVFQPVGTSLSTFELYGKGNEISTGPNIRGKFPNITYLTAIDTFILKNTQIAGTVPDWSNSTNLKKLIIPNNKLTGTFSINNSNLRRVEVENNELTGVSGLVLPKAWKLHLQGNDIIGTVPDFSNCPKLSNINLSNNGFTGYQVSSLNDNVNLKNLNVTNNNLSEGAAQRILEDMLENWNADDRGGVTISLTGNPNVRESRLIKIQPAAGIISFLRSKGWTILMNA